MIDHDPEFPFVFAFGGSKPHAKFRNKADAEFFADNFCFGIVTDTTPPPLPTDPGIYVREDADLTKSDSSTKFYCRSRASVWMSDDTVTGRWETIEESEVPTDLVPLVKGTR